MMYKFTTKFDIESEDLALQEENLSHQEIEAMQEEKDAGLLKDTLDPISDDEEDDAMGSQDLALTQTAPQCVGEKRQQSRVSNTVEAQGGMESDDEANLPLPDTQTRVSRRIRKRPRCDDDKLISD